MEAAVAMLGLGLRAVSPHVSPAWPGPAVAQDGHLWCLMGKRGQAKLLLFKDGVVCENNPKLCLYIQRQEGKRQ